MEYYDKYCKYKNKYLQLKNIKNIIIGGKNIINNLAIYDNVVGEINPEINPIISNNYSDHYLIYKKIELTNGDNLHLFNLNIAQKHRISTKINGNFIMSLLRTEYNLQLINSYKKEIFNFIICHSRANYDTLQQINSINIELKKAEKIIKDLSNKVDNNEYVEKEDKEKDKCDLKKLKEEKDINKDKLKKISGKFNKIIKNEFMKLHLPDEIDKSLIKIKETYVDDDWGKDIIKKNLEMDPETKYWYYFDLEFGIESIEDYKLRIKNCLDVIYNKINDIMSTNSNDNNLYVINLQEFNPYEEVKSVIKKFIQTHKLYIDLNLLKFKNEKQGTCSVSLVSSNTLYYISSKPDDLIEFMWKEQKKISFGNNNFKIISENSLLPHIYNFHSGLYKLNEMIDLLSKLNDKDNFIICGDLNLRLENPDEICKLLDFSNQQKIKIYITATPESNYKINYFTYDVIIYKL